MHLVDKESCPKVIIFGSKNDIHGGIYVGFTECQNADSLPQTQQYGAPRLGFK